MKNTSLCSAALPRPLAANVILPAFAAERRAADSLLLIAGASCRSISPARGSLSSKPAARRCRSMGHRQTDGRISYCFIDFWSAYYAASVNNGACNRLNRPVYTGPDLSVHGGNWAGSLLEARMVGCWCGCLSGAWCKQLYDLHINSMTYTLYQFHKVFLCFLR